MEAEQRFMTYSFGKVIGRGQYGEVRIVRDSKGRKRVCKSISKTAFTNCPDYSEDEPLLEAEKMARVSSEHVVQIHDFFEDDNTAHIIMEYCPGGDLFDFISNSQPLSEEIGAHVIRQIAVALDHCHSKGLIHRDVKPENILLSGFTQAKSGSNVPHVKLADFGTAALMGVSKRVQGFAGTIKYMAPEVICDRYYSKEVDIWSLGVVLYVSLTGKFPFRGESSEEILKSMYFANFVSRGKKWGLTREAINLISLMLNREPENRPTAKEILEHPWIRKHTCDIECNSISDLLESPRSTLGGFREDSSISSDGSKDSSETAIPMLNSEGYKFISNKELLTPENLDSVLTAVSGKKTSSVLNSFDSSLQKTAKNTDIPTAPKTSSQKTVQPTNVLKSTVSTKQKSTMTSRSQVSSSDVPKRKSYNSSKGESERFTSVLVKKMQQCVSTSKSHKKERTKSWRKLPIKFK